MSVQSEINRITSAVSDAYTSVSEKGGTIPASQVVGNLATAIDSIPTGGEGGDYNIVTTPAASSQTLDITFAQRGNENLFRSSFYNTTNLVTISDSSSASKIGYKIDTASSLKNINCNIIDTSVLTYGTQTYTLSFIAKAGGSGCRLCCDIFPDSYGTSIGLPNDSGMALTTSYQKFSFSGTIQNSTGAFVANTKFRFWALAGEHPYDIYVSDIKFEVGSTATDWCPSPYDIQTDKTVTAITYNGVSVPLPTGGSSKGTINGTVRNVHYTYYGGLWLNNSSETVLATFSPGLTGTFNVYAYGYKPSTSTSRYGFYVYVDDVLKITATQPSSYEFYINSGTLTLTSSSVIKLKGKGRSDDPGFTNGIVLYTA